MKTFLYIILIIISTNSFPASSLTCYANLKTSVVTDKIKTRKQLLALLNSLNIGVKKRDLAALTPYVQFPVTVSGIGPNFDINSKNQLAINFAKAFGNGIFMNEGKCVNVWVSYKGIMFGKTGEIWLNVATLENGEEEIFVQTINFPYKNFRTPKK
jgi:hypothetical protein